MNRQLIRLIPLVLPLGFAMDLYLPAIPTMEQSMHTDAATLHLTMSLFLAAFGCAQIVVGPITDRYGRRGVGLWGALIFTLASFACSQATSVYALIGARIVQAIGACITQVVAYSIVKDSFPPQVSAPSLSFLRAWTGIAPVIAPVMGAAILSQFGWQGCFHFLGAFGILVTLVLVYGVTETLPPARRQHHSALALAQLFQRMVTSSRFSLNVLSNIGAQGLLFCFFSISPFLIIRELGYSEADYSKFFACNALAILVTGLFTGRIVERLGANLTIQLGGILALCGGTLMLTSYGLHGLTLSGYLLPNICAASGVVLILGPGLAEAIAPYKHNIGSATALAGFLEYIFGGILGNILMRFPLNTPVYHGLMVVGCGGIILVCQQALRNRAKDPQWQRAAF
ncbi:MAG: multidrug effflux MFS transporter [Zetaproteobacteria bacterium]|nr:multidrug effflux MFS transporter [Zetaproteobacteria bacterium]